MATEYIHELGDSLSTGASSNGPHVKVIAPEKYKVPGSETYKTISVEIDSKYTKPSGGIPKSDLASAVQTSLGLADTALQSHQDISGKADGRYLFLEAGKGVAITIPWGIRTGRSSVLVVIAGNNGNYSCVQVSWFKAADNSIQNPSMHVLAFSESGASAVPEFYYTPGSSSALSGLFLKMDNSDWAYSVQIIASMENFSGVGISALDNSVIASGGVDVNSRRVFNLKGGWDKVPVMNSANAVKSGGLYTIFAGITTSLTNLTNSIQSWMLVLGTNYVKYNLNSGEVLDTGSIGSILYLGQILYEANRTTRIEVRGNFSSITDDSKFAIFMPFAFCGMDGTTQKRRKCKTFVRYTLTIINTGNSSGKIYVYCGGRSGSAYWRRGSIMVDGTDYSTPNTDARTWEDGYFNKAAIGSVPAKGSRTWEIWWHEVEDTPGQLFSGYDNTFVTTIK